jgi:hypothetical protein
MDRYQKQIEFIKSVPLRPQCYLVVYWMTLFKSMDLTAYTLDGLLSADEADEIQSLIYWTLNGGNRGFTRRILTHDHAGKIVAHVCNTTTKHTHGLWNVSVCKLGTNYLETFSLSFEFIERTASYVFLCMRWLVGHDVAGLIARKVAKMYLDDVKWIKHIERFGDKYMREKLVRGRIKRWFYCATSH